jgi:mRNA interferase RelE/StbE
MSYELNFHPDALKEWRKLDNPIREQFKKKLAERLENPHIVSAKLNEI